MSDQQGQVESLFGTFTPPKGWTPLVSLSRVKPKKAKPLVEGLLNCGDYLLISGVKNSEKSWIACYLAVCVATGKPFFGRKVKRGKVVFAYGEGNIPLRLSMVVKGMGLKKRPQNLFPYKLRADLGDDDAAKDFLHHIPPKTVLVVLDNFEKFWADDQDIKAVGQAMKLMFTMKEKTSAALVHHQVKNQKSGANKHALSKGLSKIVNCADATWALEKNPKTGGVLVEPYNREQEEIETFAFIRSGSEAEGYALKFIEKPHKDAAQAVSKTVEDAEKVYGYLADIEGGESEAKIRAAMQSKYDMSRGRVEAAIARLKADSRITHNGKSGPASRLEAV